MTIHFSICSLSLRKTNTRMNSTWRKALHIPKSITILFIYFIMLQPWHLIAFVLMQMPCNFRRTGTLSSINLHEANVCMKAQKQSLRSGDGLHNAMLASYFHVWLENAQSRSSVIQAEQQPSKKHLQTRIWLVILKLKLFFFEFW